MAIELPEPIARYFAAVNRQDIDAAASTFDVNAIVADEGRQREGIAAIRKWIEETTAKYRPTASVTGNVEKDGQTVVTARVSGTFPGSPVDIHYAFTLKGRAIARLEIHR